MHVHTRLPPWNTDCFGFTDIRVKIMQTGNEVLNSKQRHLLKRFFWELVAVFEGAVYLLHVHTLSAF